MDSVFATIRGHQDRIPVDIRGMATGLGLDVYDLPLGNSVSGSLMRSPKGFYINVNSKHHENRRRFTIAHEIAHYVLHADLIESEVVDNALYRSEQISGRLESQANALAAELLMPGHLVRSRFDQLATTDATNIVATMAEEFQVSRQAMAIRLSNVRQVELAIA